MSDFLEAAGTHEAASCALAGAIMRFPWGEVDRIGAAYAPQASRDADKLDDALRRQAALLALPPAHLARVLRRMPRSEDKPEESKRRSLGGGVVQVMLVNALPQHPLDLARLPSFLHASIMASCVESTAAGPRLVLTHGGREIALQLSLLPPLASITLPALKLGLNADTFVSAIAAQTQLVVLELDAECLQPMATLQLIAGLRSMRALVSLTLHNCSCSSVAWQELGTGLEVMPALTELSLSFSERSDRTGACSAVAHAASLRRLQLGRWPVFFGEHIRRLAPAVQELEIAALSTLTSLTELSLVCCPPDPDQSGYAVKDCRSLAAALAPMARMVKLALLVACRSDVHEEDDLDTLRGEHVAAALSRLAALESLELGGWLAKHTVPRALASVAEQGSWPRLTRLALSADTEDQLPTGTDLCSALAGQLVDVAVPLKLVRQFILAAPALTTLSIADRWVGEVQAEDVVNVMALRVCDKLQHLRAVSIVTAAPVINTSIFFTLLQPLSALQSLRLSTPMNLGQAGVSDAVKAMTNLTELELSRFDASPARQFMNALPRLQLQRLRLCANAGSEGRDQANASFAALTSALPTSLRELSLEHMFDEVHTALWLLEPVRAHACLATVDLREHHGVDDVRGINAVERWHAPGGQLAAVVGALAAFNAELHGTKRFQF